MSLREALLAAAFLALVDVWLVWYAVSCGRERYRQMEARRRKARRHMTYAELHYERKRHGKDRS